MSLKTVVCSSSYQMLIYSVFRYCKASSSHNGRVVESQTEVKVEISAVVVIVTAHK